MTAFAHASVLLPEVLEHLEPRPGAVYVDCTLGGAGHARAVLLAAPDCRLIGIDRDPSALAAAREVLADVADRVTFVHGRFGDVASILATLGIARVDGFIADLGVSSPQLDRAERGFSFMKDGPLDMRMDPTAGRTALELLRELTIDELGDILRDYGEERHHRKIARVVKEAIRADAIATTIDLAKLVATCIPMAEQRKSRIHPATRTFQALRIAVNAELDEVEQFLAAFPDLLNPGGRCVVIAFHSLEDRLVKHRFRDLAWTSSLPPRLAREAGERVEAVCTPIARKVVASDDETATNPRARSARLRACERTSAPNLPAQSHP